MNQLAAPLKFVPGLAVSLIACAINSAYAAEDSHLNKVVVEAKANSDSELSKAAKSAPTRASLEATQPQSIIGRDYIENSSSPVADFSAIAAIAPSVTIGISTNGPGLGETKNSIRGFKDGEFAITYDGIPFGDTNGPSHHSTAYFPANVLGEVVVERGPGNASSLGQATFGGSINLFSRPIANEETVSPIFSFGSWNTRLIGARYDSGVKSNMGDAKFAINVQRQTSDGYLTHSPIQGSNAMVKFERPLGESTLLTVNVNLNSNWYYQSDVVKGLTAAQAITLGKNYAMGEDPKKANYFGYNRTDKHTALAYVRLQSDLGDGWAIDNNTYYYNYNNNTLSSAASDVTAGLGTVKSSTGANITNQMPGYRKLNGYWVGGDVLKGTKQTELGLARAGVWVERAVTNRFIKDYNLLNDTPNFDQAAVANTSLTGINNVAYDQGSGWSQYQPFVEFEWAAAPNLTVTPGLKYAHTNLRIDAMVNQTGRTQLNMGKDFNATLPFLTANYKFTPELAAYAQYAKGMLVPSIGSYQSAKATLTQIDPQTSTNYQLGMVYKTDTLTFDTDVYYIDFKNKIATVPGTSGANAMFYNQGGVEYKGLEAELTYAFDNGISIYGNGSLNRATIKDSPVSPLLNGKAIAGVPNSTSGLGLLYKSGDWTASLVDKIVGTTYALDGEAYKMKSYSSMDFNVGYTIRNPGMDAKNLKVSFGVFNVMNHTDILSVSAKNGTVGSATYGTVNAGDTFTYQPERSYMVTLRAEF
jgi:iron complex outermembrane receptor protein